MPNNDLISRSDLQKVFERECVGECGCCKHVKHNPEGCALIDDAPAVDAEPVRHGKWIETYAYGAWHYDCPFCDDGYATKEREKKPVNYCSNCGAKMDKEN